MKSIFISVLLSLSAAKAGSISKDGFIYIMANGVMRTCEQIFVMSVKTPGVVVLDIKFDGEGKVINAFSNDEKSTIKNEKLSSCIINSFAGHTLRMEATGKEKMATATFQFPR